MRFDFENAEPWGIGNTLLPVGLHVVTIDTAEGGETRNGNPQVELGMSNDDGTLKDWLVYAEQNGVSKVKGLFVAAGLPLSNDDADPDTGHLKAEVVAKLVGRKVRLRAVDEPDYKDPSKTRRRVAGYEAPSTGSAPTAAVAPDDDIPF